MRTLFPSNYNWPVFILAALIIRVTFIDMSTWTFVAIMISIYQFSLLFNSIGHIIPTRHLLGSFMCLQFFVGSCFAYNGADKYQYYKYRMLVPESVYYTYVLPAVVLFIIGLHLNAGKYKGEIVSRKGVEAFVDKNPAMPYIFIILGFLASFISGFFSSDMAFVFYILGSFKFIGLFLLVLGTKQVKLLAMVVVIGSIVSSSLASGMFHDFLTWTIFTIAVFAIKYKFDFKIKMIGLAGFVFIALVIQVLKGSYRTEIGKQDANAGVSTFTQLYEEKSAEDEGFLSFATIAGTNTRINQGFIITNILKTVPDIEPFANGAEMKQVFEAAIMPRILAPDKLKAGDRTIFVKYSGIPIQTGTSMGLSSVGDAYVNFGIVGGIIFMFVLGLLYSEILNSFYKHSFTYPVLILFVPLSFYYPIRPDCELQTILGHLFKSIFLIFVMIKVFANQFKIPIMRRKPMSKLDPQLSNPGFSGT